MPNSVASPVIAELRERIARLEGGTGRARKVLPFGVADIDWSAKPDTATGA